MDKQAFNINKYLVFDVCDEKMSVKVKNVLEVFDNPVLSPIPGDFQYIEGLINFRGNIVTVIDLYNKLFAKKNPEKNNFKVLIIKLEKSDENLFLGLKVTKIYDVVDIQDNNINSIPDFGKNLNIENFEGVFKYKNDFVMILNCKKVF